MPATDSAMGASSGGMGAPSGGPDGRTTANPSILGLLAFGLTTLLFGLSNLPGPWNHSLAISLGGGFYANGHPVGTITTTITIFGGLVLILIGLLIFLKGSDTFWGTAFLGYGAFFTTIATLSGVIPFNYAVSAIALIWLLFTLTFLISSMKHGWVTFFFFLFLFVGYILLFVESWQEGAASKISGEEWGLIAGIWIVAGVIAWYLGTAKLTELTYSRKLLPT